MTLRKAFCDLSTCGIAISLPLLEFWPLCESISWEMGDDIVIWSDWGPEDMTSSSRLLYACRDD